MIENDEKQITKWWMIGMFIILGCVSTEHAVQVLRHSSSFFNKRFSLEVVRKSFFFWYSQAFSLLAEKFVAIIIIFIVSSCNSIYDWILFDSELTLFSTRLVKFMFFWKKKKTKKHPQSTRWVNFSWFQK